MDWISLCHGWMKLTNIARKNHYESNSFIAVSINWFNREFDFYFYTKGVNV